MADTVDYGKAKIDFAVVMTRLHQAALANLGQTDIVLENTAFAGKKFSGAGDYQLILRPKDGRPIPQDRKPSYLEVAQRYVKYFVGQKQSDEMKETDLLPIMTRSDDGQPQQDKRNQQNGDENAVSESSFQSWTDRFVFESVVSMFEDDDGSSTAQNVHAYVVPYQISVLGHANSPGKFSFLKGIAKDMLGSLVDDLASLEIRTLGGEPIRVGKMFDPKTYQSVFGKMDVDASSAPGRVSDVLGDRLPGFDGKVKVMDARSLVEYLRKNRKVGGIIDGKEVADVTGMIQEANYSVVIEVDTEDKSYGEFTTQMVAEVCTKAFGKAFRFSSETGLTANRVKSADVILVRGVSGAMLESRAPSATVVENMVNMLFEEPKEGAEDSPTSTEKKPQKTGLAYEKIKRLIEKYGARRIIAYKDDVLRYVNSRYSGDEDIKKYLQGEFEKFFKLSDQNAMVVFVKGRFQKLSNDDKNALAFLDCLEVVSSGRDGGRSGVFDMYIVPSTRLKERYEDDKDYDEVNGERKK